MVQNLDPKETGGLEKALMSKIVQSKALVDLLERRGIFDGVSKDEQDHKKKPKQWHLIST